MDHRQLVRLAAGNGIHRVKGKVIMIRIFKADALQCAPLVFLRVDELLTQQRRGGLGLPALTDIQRLVGGVIGHNHGQEHTVLPVNGDHTVGGGGLVENGIALAQNLFVVAHLDAHSALNDQIELLTGMGGGMDGKVLQLLRILIGDPVGSCQLLAKHRCHILNGNAVLAGSHQTFSPAGYSIAGQLGAVSLQQVGDFQAKDLGTLVHKGKGQIDRACLIGAVDFLRDLCQVGHFLHTVTQNLAHFPNTQCDLLELGCGRLIGHSFSSFPEKTKKRLKINLETSKSYPRYHSICGKCRLFRLQQVLTFNAGIREKPTDTPRSVLRLRRDGSSEWLSAGSHQVPALWETAKSDRLRQRHFVLKILYHVCGQKSNIFFHGTQKK